VDVKHDAFELRARLDQGGHRGDVRALALSSDDALLLSASAGGAKLWTPGSGACVGTLEGGYGLCCVFAPGNRHVVVGTKVGGGVGWAAGWAGARAAAAPDTPAAAAQPGQGQAVVTPSQRTPLPAPQPPPQEGTLEVFDVGACARVHVEKAHAGAVWSLALLPDKSGFVSGSADKTVKFWTWAVEEARGGGGDGGKRKKKKGSRGGEEDEAAAAADAGGGAAAGGGRHLSVALTRELEMAEDVLCVRVSPDGRLLAVALLDATIKVYYMDRWGARGEEKGKKDRAGGRWRVQTQVAEG
jgi:U3 small nucleolar RNA-associated protein 12